MNSVGWAIHLAFWVVVIVMLWRMHKSHHARHHATHTRLKEIEEYLATAGRTQQEINDKVIANQREMIKALELLTKQVSQLEKREGV